MDPLEKMTVDRRASVHFSLGIKFSTQEHPVDLCFAIVGLHVSSFV